MLKIQKWKSKFLLVALGQAVSLLGSSGVQFALIWWLAEQTSSPMVLGMSGLVAFLPMTLFSPLAGIAADRYNRKYISIFSDMAMGLAALLYAALLFFFELPVWTLSLIHILETPYVFGERVVGGAVPKNYFPAVEKGIQDSVGKGPMAGYPVVGVKATLFDGSYHPVDSSEMAFKTAARQAFKSAFIQANPVILEPIVSLSVVVPDSYTGDIMGCLLYTSRCV